MRIIFWLPVLATFSAALAISSGRNELAFFDIHDAAGLARGDKQIGLAAKERRDLQHVANFRGRSHLRDFVHVGEDRQASPLGDGGEDAQAFFQARAAVGGNRTAIGFVEGRLENQRNAEFAGCCCEPLGQHRGVRFVFDYARPGNHEKRLAWAESDFADRE